jgi:hypothetical protein
VLARTEPAKTKAATIDVATANNRCALIWPPIHTGLPGGIQPPAAVETYVTSGSLPPEERDQTSLQKKVCRASRKWNSPGTVDLPVDRDTRDGSTWDDDLAIAYRSAA